MGVKTLEFLTLPTLIKGLGRRGREKKEEARVETQTQLDLEAGRRAELVVEEQTRVAQKKRAETAGQRFGRGRARFLGALGFGSGRSGAGIGRGSLFGN